MQELQIVAEHTQLKLDEPELFEKESSKVNL